MLKNVQNENKGKSTVRTLTGPNVLLCKEITRGGDPRTLPHPSRTFPAPLVLNFLIFILFHFEKILKI